MTTNPATASGELRGVFDQVFTAQDFALESGRILPELRIAYETYGRLAPDRRNAVLLTHGYTSNHHMVGRGGSTLADTDIVVTAASGKVNKQTAAPADATAAMLQVNSVVGRPTEAVTNVDGTTFKAIVKFPIP